jgi:phosphonate transport system substrate-binding protein
MNKFLQIRLKYLCFFLLITPFCCASNAVADIKLSFGVYTADKPTVVVKTFKPILKKLEQSVSFYLGETVKIKLQVASTYEGGISDISMGKVDFSRLGPVSYIKAKAQQPNLQILVIEENLGKKPFHGVIAVPIDSGVKRISDLKGKHFAFGNESSTIGRFLAQNYLFQHGVKSTDLARFYYLERHDKVGAAVALGQYDAGALKQSTYDRLVKEGAKLKVLATFNNVSKPWIARSELDEKLILALKAGLLEMKDPNTLKELKNDGFIEGLDSNYNVIRNAIEQNFKFFN